MCLASYLSKETVSIFRIEILSVWVTLIHQAPSPLDEITGIYIKTLLNSYLQEVKASNCTEECTDNTINLPWVSLPLVLLQREASPGLGSSWWFTLSPTPTPGPPPRPSSVFGERWMYSLLLALTPSFQQRLPISWPQHPWSSLLHCCRDHWSRVHSFLNYLFKFPPVIPALKV